uniref:Uncharacterized protein n=1 Tax=Rhizophora mucronata TaxID=61149 RepID=A0A2P2NI41_RHIMU
MYQKENVEGRTL